MSAAESALGKLVLADDTGFTTNLWRLDFVDLDNGVTLELRDMNGTRGRYTKSDQRVRHNRTTVTPRLTCQPTAVELGNILAWATGGTPTGSPTVSYPLGNTATARSLWYLPNQGTGWQLLNVAVDAITLHGSSGEPLTVELDLVGQTYNRTSASYPATTLDVSTAPYIFSDLVLTHGGVENLVRDMSLSVRNNIDRGRFLNSLTLTGLYKLHREVAWSVEVPAGDYDSEWDDALTQGVATVATWTQPGSATAVLTCTSPRVRYVPRNPTVPFQNESFLQLAGEAYSADLSTENLTVTQKP